MLSYWKTLKLVFMCGKKRKKRTTSSVQYSSNGGAPTAQSSRVEEDAETLSEVVATRPPAEDASSAPCGETQEVPHVLYDPITMDVINDASNRKIDLNGHNYDIVTLAQYFFASKDFRDPLTRQSLTEDQILDIDMHSFSFMTTLNNSVAAAAVKVPKAPWNYGEAKESSLWPMPPDVISTVTTTDDDALIEASPTGTVATEGINLPSLLPIFRKVSAETCSEMQNKEKTVQTLDNIIGGLIAEVMDLLEEDATDTEGGLDDFQFSVLRIISELEYPWKELKALDHQSAYLHMQSYLAFLRGSTKKPTKDPHNRLPNILNMLNRQCLTKEDIGRHMDERRERSMSYDATVSEVEDAHKPVKRPRAESV